MSVVGITIADFAKSAIVVRVARPWRECWLCLLLLLGSSLFGAERIEGQFRPEEFFESIEKLVEKVPEKGSFEADFEERTVCLVFEPWEIAQPRFRKVFKAPRIPQTLFFKTMGYNATDKTLEVPCVIFQAREAKSAYQRAMPLLLKLGMKESDGWKAIRQFRRRELRIELTVAVGGVRWEYQGQRERFFLRFSDPRAKLYRLREAWLSPPVTLTHDESISPNAVQEREDVAEEFEQKPRRVQLHLKTAEFQSLNLFADWEPGHQGWYARDFLDNYGHNHLIAVLHRGQEGSRMWTALPESLPPGEYQVFLKPNYTRQRVRENTVRVTLNDATHEFRWHYVRGLGSRGWVCAPVFITRKAGKLLEIEGVQVGGGGLGGIPEPPVWTILLREAFVTDDLDLRSPAELLEPEEESE